MIPILYEQGETAFTTNGIGRLIDALECTVTEERNGPYELYMKYPIVGAWYEELKNSRIILATPANGKRPQPFRIYRITAPMQGVSEVYAEHISYQLNSIPVMPFASATVAGALNGMVQNAAQDCPFTVWTDKETQTTFRLSKPEMFRALLGGVQGSILDTFGTGEYEFDRYAVKLWKARGKDSGVTLRYGKDLTELVKDETLENTITGICPFWGSDDLETVVTIPEKAIWVSNDYPYQRTEVKDFTPDFEEQPTVDQLRARTVTYINDNDIGKPKLSLSVQFVPLEQVDGVSLGNPRKILVLPAAAVTDGTVTLSGVVDGDTVELDGAYFEIDYQQYKVLERLNLCDYVTIEYAALGVSVRAEIVHVVWDVLRDRYESMEIGDPKTTLAKTINRIETDAAQNLQEQTAVQKIWVDLFTSMILGAKGGSVRLLDTDGDGEPDTLYIADNPDITLAQKIWRFNYEGWGASENGYDGPFNMGAVFADGGTIFANVLKIVNIDATNINTGTLNAENVNVTNINGRNIKDQTIGSDPLDNGAVTERTIETYAVTGGTNGKIAYSTVSTWNTSGGINSSLASADNYQAATVYNTGAYPGYFRCGSFRTETIYLGTYTLYVNTEGFVKASGYAG